MFRIYRLMSAVVLLLLVLLPTSVVAQESTTSIYLPLALKASADVDKSLVQFRSCGGYDGTPLQYQEVPVGSLTALTESCTGGEAYPGPIAGENEGVAIGAYWWKDYNWHLVSHIGQFYGQDVQFMVNMGTGGALPPYPSVNIQDGQLNVFKGDVVYTTTTTIEGWELTFHPDGVKPYVQFSRDLTKIWVVMDRADGVLWVEVQTPRVELLATSVDIPQDDNAPQPPAWGTWYYAQCHGHMPNLEVMESDFILARYPLN